MHEKNHSAESTLMKNPLNDNIIIENILSKNPHNKLFNEEKLALEYINNNKNKNLYLISENISNFDHKKYYTIDHETLFMLTSIRKFSLYEHYGPEDNIKLSFNINVKKKEIPQESNKKAYIDNLINKIIKLMELNLEQYGIKNSEIIVLESSSEEQTSVHIIYTNVYFQSAHDIKVFTMFIESELICTKVIDPFSYKQGYLRLLWSPEYGLSNTMELYKTYNCQYNNNKLGNKKLFFNSLLRNINDKCQLVSINIPKDVKIVEKDRIKLNKNAFLRNIEEKNIKTPLTLIKKYLDILNENRLNNYDNWVKIGMIIFNCHPNIDGFNLWNEWSSKGINYAGRELCAYKWNSFKFYSIGVGTLKFLAREDNLDMYSEIECILEKRTFETIKLNSNYLIDQNEKIKDKKSIVTKELCKWINNKKIKTLAIRSTYDTGKTTLVKKLLTEYEDKFERILFVSYRQTLTNELHGNFKKLDINSYLDRAYNSDRLICQIESLHKIANKNIDNNKLKVEIPSFDLIVIDELESVLNHFESTTIKEKEKTFNLLSDIIYNSDKILALDGDFNNRSFEYISNIMSYNEEKPEYIILENEVKKNKTHFKFTNDKNNFDKQIEQDLENGKKIIIVSMSLIMAEYYYRLYSKIYKCALYTSKNDDKLKEEFKNVNDVWIKLDLIIYSPSVESGINFDKKHIYKKYIILSSHSTSPRGLLQMASRCRKIENPEVMVYLNSLPYFTKISFYKHDEVKEYVLGMFHKYLSKKVVIDSKTKKKIHEYEYSLYSKILVHNMVEKLNKYPKYFVAYLLKLLDEKGHTYELLDLSNIKTIHKEKIPKEEILNANDIDENQFDILFKKVKANEATRKDKIMIEKYLLKVDWKNNNITADFLDKFYGRTYVLYNLRWLIDETKVDPYLELNNEKIADFNKIEKLEQIKIIKELLNRIGFDSVLDTKNIPKKQFDENWNNLLKNYDIINNKSKFEPLFGVIKNNKMSSTKAFLGFINSIFKEWGFSIKLHQNITKKRDDQKKRKSVVNNYYVLKYIDNINQYL